MFPLFQPLVCFILFKLYELPIINPILTVLPIGFIKTLLWYFTTLFFYRKLCALLQVLNFALNVVFALPKQGTWPNILYFKKWTTLWELQLRIPLWILNVSPQAFVEKMSVSRMKSQTCQFPFLHDSDLLVISMKVLLFERIFWTVGLTKSSKQKLW